MLREFWCLLVSSWRFLGFIDYLFWGCVVLRLLLLVEGFLVLFFGDRIRFNEVMYKFVYGGL